MSWFARIDKCFFGEIVEGICAKGWKPVRGSEGFEANKGKEGVVKPPHNMKRHWTWGGSLAVFFC